MNRHITSHKLSNGLQIFFLEKFKDFNTLDIQFTICSGSRQEDKNTYPGTFHFVEHVIAKQFEKKLQNHSWIPSYISGTFQASTNSEETSYAFTIKTTDIKLTAKLLNIITNPTIPSSKEIISEKKVVQEEILESSDELSQKKEEYFRNQYFKGSSLEHPVIGDIESIAKMQPKDIEECIDSYYCSSNCYLVIVGNVDTHKLIDELEHKLKFRSPAQKPTTNRIPISPEKNKIYFKHDKTQQVELSLFWMKERTSFRKDQITNLVCEVLQLYFFNEFREGGLVYSVDVDNTYYTDFTYLYISAKCAPNKAKDLYIKLRKLLEKLARSLTTKELELCKKFRLDNNLLDQKYPRAELDSIAFHYRYSQKPLTIGEVGETMKSIKLSEIKNAITEILDNPSTLFVFGDLSTRSKSEITKIWQSWSR